MPTMAGERPYFAGTRGQCPHCRTTVRFESAENYTEEIPAADETARFAMKVLKVLCPACSRPIIVFEKFEMDEDGWYPQDVPNETELVWPKAISRSVVPLGVPDEIRRDYEEAAIVLANSEKASAALSRRCLQALLRDVAGMNRKNLSQQIDAVLPTLPGYLQPQLDAVRNIGNFAAHPIKSSTTGEIIDVEPGEAEWNLDVLDLLFDFYFVQPKIARDKKEALNKKLKAAGKSAMK